MCTLDPKPAGIPLCSIENIVFSMLRPLGDKQPGPPSTTHPACCAQIQSYRWQVGQSPLNLIQSIGFSFKTGLVSLKTGLVSLKTGLVGLHLEFACTFCTPVHWSRRYTNMLESAVHQYVGVGGTPVHWSRRYTSTLESAVHQSVGVGG